VTTGNVCDVALAADGRTVTVADDDRTIQLRDAVSGELLHRFRAEWDGPIPRPHDGLVLSPGGTAATVGGSWDGTVPVWEVRTGRLLRTLTVSAGLVYGVVLSPDGRTLAAAARDESVRVLDVTTGKTLHTISRPHGAAGVTTLAFAPDGKAIVTGATDGTICCWPLP
jgi:WD40 repeat protein